MSCTHEKYTEEWGFQPARSQQCDWCGTGTECVDCTEERVATIRADERRKTYAELAAGPIPHVVLDEAAHNAWKAYRWNLGWDEDGPPLGWEETTEQDREDWRFYVSRAFAALAAEFERRAKGGTT